ncbi:response regulator transcription factor [Streptomyces sp. NPDC005863]|uniref:response regulator transcription factor n=1 Tax=unclassified Streptomyces TaxID=2593676 RepID=UPI0033C9E257
MTVSFTHRERQVVQELAEGKTDREIACRLERSPNTVRHYIGTAKKKVGAGGQVSLVSRSYDLGLLQPPARESGTVDLPPEQQRLIRLLALNTRKRVMATETRMSLGQVTLHLRQLKETLNARTRPHVVTRARQYGLLQTAALASGTVGA